MSTPVQEIDVLKSALKEALQESFQENRDWFREVFAEAMEDFALVEAVREGNKTKEVDREDVFKVLDQP